MCVRGELWKSPHNVFLGGRWRGWTPKEGAPLWTSLIRFMSLNDRRGAEATSPLVARSVQAGQRPVFCKRDFSPKPPSSMTQRSRRKPLLQKDGFCRRGFRPEPPSSMRQGSRRKTLPYYHASRIDLAALVGPSVHAEPRRAADWYPNLRSLEEKIPLVIYKAGFCLFIRQGSAQAEESQNHDHQSLRGRKLSVQISFHCCWISRQEAGLSNH